jgi:hypothetical protein
MAVGIPYEVKSRPDKFLLGLGLVGFGFDSMASIDSYAKRLRTKH